MLPILVIALFTPLARLLMPAVAAKATRAIISHILHNSLTGFVFVKATPAI